MKFLFQLFNWFRFLLIFLGLTLTVIIYPSTRFFSLFFIIQTLFLLLFWMFMNLGDTITSFIIDYYLNRWAYQAQLVDTNSNLYILRITSYSRAFKSAISFIFIVIGVIISIKFIGIEGSLLAVAGGIVLLFAFFARNVIEDIVNGVLILWTDRYAIGDIITVGNVEGFVENINFYTTQIRDSEGSLITIPNRQITVVQNKK